LAGPVQPEARPNLPPDPVSTCQGPQGDPGVPNSRNISEPPPVPSAAPPPGPPPPAATRDEGAPKPPVKPEKEPKHGRESAIAKADKAPAKDPPIATETPGYSQVEEIETPQLQEEAEPDFIPATASVNGIGCYRDFRGILHITNVSTPEPVKLAELRLAGWQPASPQPGRSPEPRSQVAAKTRFCPPPRMTLLA
jgi:hypothetical protein